MKYLLQKYTQLRKWCERHFLKLSIALVLYISFLFYYGYKIPWFDKHPDWGYFPNHTNPDIVIEEIYPNLHFETMVQPKGSNQSLIFAHKKITDNTDSLLIFNTQFKLLYSEKIPLVNVNQYNPGFYPDTANNRIIVKVWDTLPSLESKYYYYAYNLSNFTKTILPDSYGENLIDSVADRYKILTIEDIANRNQQNANNIKYLGFRITGNEFEFSSKWRLHFTSGDNGYTSKPSNIQSRFNQTGIGYFELQLLNNTANFKIKDGMSNSCFYQFNSISDNTLFINYLNKYYKISKK